MDNMSDEDKEKFANGMKDTIADLRLSAIKKNYTLEDVSDEEIEGWVKKSLISEDPMRMLRVLAWRIEEFGKPIPGNQVHR